MAEHVHCWHLTHALGASETVKGREDSVCCHCAATQQRLYLLVRDPKHGPRYPVFLRVFDDGGEMLP